MPDRGVAIFDPAGSCCSTGKTGNGDGGEAYNWQRRGYVFCFWPPKSFVMLTAALTASGRQYAERGIFQRLLERLRSIAPSEKGFRPVLVTAPGTPLRPA